MNSFFKSLLGRSLISGSIILSILFVATRLSNQQLLNVLDNSHEISTKFESFRLTIKAAKEPLKEIESQLYLYTILLTAEQKKYTLQYIDDIFVEINQLEEHPLSLENKDFISDIKALQKTLAMIQQQIKPILNFTYNERFKRISKIVEEMTPNNLDFNREISESIHLHQFNSEKGTSLHRHIEKLFQNLHFNWIKHVSTTRILLAAKTGVLGDNINVFHTFKNNLKNYQQSINNYLSQIEEYINNDEVDQEQILSLKKIRTITQIRFNNIDKLLLLPYQQQMREDIPIIQETLKPLFIQANNILNKMDKRLESLIRKNLSDNKKHIEQTSSILWSYFAFVLLLFGLLYLVFEFWLRRPLLKLNKAIQLEGKGNFQANSINLQKLGVDEIDSLIDDFSLMQKQIKNRQEALEASLKQVVETQEQLVEAERMASLGNLVAGVAHEINTPIGICVTAGSTLQSTISAFNQSFQSGQLTKSEFIDNIEEINELMTIILNNLARSATLIRSFKQVAVDQSSNEHRSFELMEYIDEIILNLKPKLKNTKINIAVNGPSQILMSSYPGAFSQILTNLIINSIIHGYEKNAEGSISITTSVNDNLLEVIYQDDGKGMSQEEVQKIYEPFYTTKRGYGGSGLGMNITYNLVTQQLKGTIQCSSNLGEGVQFKIRCPIDIPDK